MEKKKRKRSSPVRWIISAAVLIVLVIAGAVLVRGADTVSVSGITRYARALVTKKQEVSEIVHEHSRGCVYTSISNGIAAVSRENITVYDKYGETLFTEKFTCASPAVSSNGKSAAAYDIGGKTIKIFTLDAVLHVITTNNPVIRVSVNSVGYIAVCTEESGYKGSVTVYDSTGKAVYKWYSADGYVSSAEVSQDGKMLSVVTLSEAGSSVIWMSLTEETEKARFTLPDEVILDIRAQNAGGVICITENRVLSVMPDGIKGFDYDLSEKKLEDYAFTSGGKTVVVYSDYTMNGALTMKTLGSSGEELGTYSTMQKITDTAICEDFVSVVYSGKIIVYNISLEEVSTYESEEETEVILFRRDGAVLCVSAENIKIYK